MTSTRAKCSSAVFVDVAAPNPTACAHEWGVATAAEAASEKETQEDGLTRDVNGNILEQGDTCVLIKDLAKGKLKKGLKVKIRLGDYGDGHDCQAAIPKEGTYMH
jgi:uncharacterized Zn ribbon protein